MEKTTIEWSTSKRGCFYFVSIESVCGLFTEYISEEEKKNKRLSLNIFPQIIMQLHKKKKELTFVVWLCMRCMRTIMAFECGAYTHINLGVGNDLVAIQNLLNTQTHSICLCALRCMCFSVKWSLFGCAFGYVLVHVFVQKKNKWQPVIVCRFGSLSD